MIYPAVVAFIFLGMINDKIKNNNVFKCAIWVAVILGVLHTLPGIKAFENVTALVNFAATLDKLPGGNIGFFWAIPVLIAGIIGRFIPSKNA